MELYKHKTGKVDILFCVDNDRCEVAEFIDGLEDIPRSKVRFLLNEIALNGLPGNRRRYELINGGPVGELKTHYPEIRMFCFRDRNSIIITHGTKKPKPKGLDRHVSKTLRIKEVLEREGLI